jgi:hypothetical protein
MKLNYVPYFTDGSGRDRYIAFDNAGFFSNKESKKENVRRTGTSLDTKISYKYVSPYMKAPNFHYHSDGNGRDSYIYSNGGGLFYDSKPLNSYKLTDFLRDNENYTSYNRPGKVWVSKSQDKYNKLLRAKEKDIINRLYENEKKKFVKKKDIEDNSEEKINEYRTLQTEVETTKLPKLRLNNSKNLGGLDTLNNAFEKEKNDDEKEISKTIDNKKRRIIFHKNNTNNEFNEELLLKSLNKINNFDASKKLKRTNKSFNQAYFHIRNNNEMH